jgi:hypothetical protein
VNEDCTADDDVERNVSKILSAGFMNVPCDTVDIATEKHRKFKRDIKMKRGDCGMISRHREMLRARQSSLDAFFKK